MRLLAVLLLAVPLLGCAEQGAPPVDAPPDHPSREVALGEGWSRMPVPHLSPRRGPLVATVAGEVVVVGGGYTGPPLDPTLGGADGGEVDSYGRVLPFGGRLDPVSGKWSPLPDAPDAYSGGWPVEAVGGTVSAAERWLDDDAAQRWTRLPRPDGAPTQPGPATWLEDTLVVYGGERWDDDGGPEELTPEAVHSTDACTFTRPS